MYQLEVKRWLIHHLLNPGAAWSVCVDVDAMERARGGTHPADKQRVAESCLLELRSLGCRIGRHEVYGRADIVAVSAKRTLVVEVEGDSSRQREQGMYSALGQLLLSMRDENSDVRYAIAVPDDEKWETQLRKVPMAVCEKLRLHLLLVSPAGVREVNQREQFGRAAE